MLFLCSVRYRVVLPGPLFGQFLIGLSEGRSALWNHRYDISHMS